MISEVFRLGRIRNGKNKFCKNFQLLKHLKQNLYTNITTKPLTNKNLKYLLILDFEATCDTNKIVQEIIEFPCLKVNIRNLVEESRFHYYVKPVINPELPYFCIELTGILQEMVENEKTFPEVYNLFEEWRKNEGLTDENSLYLTSGDWDLGLMMPNQCAISNLELPSHMKKWIDIKKLYADHFHYYSKSLINIFKAFNLEYQGRAHSGINDCLNLLNLVKILAKVHIEFYATSSIISTDHGYRVRSLQHNKSII